MNIFDFKTIKIYYNIYNSIIKYMKTIIFILITIYSVSVHGQTDKKDSTKELKTRIAELEEKTLQLEKRIDFLERKLSNMVIKSSEPFPSSGDYRKKENWRKLTRLLTKNQVKEYLGEPNKITQSYGIEIWYYPDATGGSVSFDEDSRLQSWMEP